MDTITIDLGTEGLTVSSTFSGGNISPRITLRGIDKDMEYICLIVQNKSGNDPLKCIWTIWNIPSVGYVPPGFDAGAYPKFPFPAVQGVNDFGEQGWHGPSPGLGVRDKLLFQVFGRNDSLSIPPESTMDEVIDALRDGKTVAYGSLECFYHG
ncbi:MAG TPA: YbhB/YbcL family Raf kinase inhibitor-like protein [Methanocorpusculum sp.]|nr:YbhB/YbcL family Raf kinase inhibitor-like protein [Methanocorpusculum sp.]